VSWAPRAVWAGVAVLVLVACGGQSGPSVLLMSAAGPMRQVLGVGVGYAHNEAGAVAAAVGYAEAAATPVFPADPADERQRVAAYAASAEEQDLLAQRLQSLQGYDSSYGALAAHARGLRSGAHLYPLSVTMASYSDTNATVSVWATLVEYSPNVFRALYLTESVALVWERGDWKFLPRETSATLGPVPQVTQAQTAAQPPQQVDWAEWGR
jgi:hypothetical protein